MSELNFFIEIVKNVGFPAILFIVFYIYHKSQTEILLKTIKSIEDREQKLNEYLSKQNEILQWISSSISRMEYKIDLGMQCPLKKKDV